MLMQGRMMTLTKSEVDHLPITSLQHYMGFTVGANEKQKLENRQRGPSSGRRY